MLEKGEKKHQKCDHFPSWPTPPTPLWLELGEIVFRVFVLVVPASTAYETMGKVYTKTANIGRNAYLMSYCDLLHVDIFGCLDLSTQYLVNASFWRSLAFKMSKLEMLVILSQNLRLRPTF